MTLTDDSRLGVDTEPAPALDIAPALICAEPGAGADLLIKALMVHGVQHHAVRDPADAGRRPLTDRLVSVLAPEGAVAAVRWDQFAALVVKRKRRDQRRGVWATTLTKALPRLRYVHLIRLAETEARTAQWQWIGFFCWARQSRLTITYEDLLADPDRVAGEVLAYLDVAAPVAEGNATIGRPADDIPARRPGPRRPSRAAVSVVVVCHNEGENLPLTLTGIRATVADDVEVLVVDDQSTDGSAERLARDDVRVITTTERGGVVGARNAGAKAATGDIIVFADAHVDPAPGWLEPLVAALGTRSIACATPALTDMNHRQAYGYGFTWNSAAMRMQWLRGPRDDLHEVPFACGCLMAFRRDDFETVGGFDPGLVRWGSEDAEIGINLWRHGRATVVVPQSTVAHLFRPAGPYDVARYMVIHNSLRVAVVHFPTATLAAVLGASRRYDNFGQAYAHLADSDVWTRRDEVAARARYDGAWFLDRFRMDGLR